MKRNKSETSVFPILMMEKEAQHKQNSKIFNIYNPLVKKRSQYTQSQFYAPQIQKTESEYDSVFSQVTQQKAQQQQILPSRIITNLKRDKKSQQLAPTLSNMTPYRNETKKNPYLFNHINYRDKDKLQQQLIEYVDKTHKNQEYKLSKIHARRSNIQSLINLEVFQCLDDILPNELLLKKKYKLKEEDMFRTSLGLEKVILQRLIRDSQND